MSKIYVYDLETAPNLSWTWAKYQQDVIDFKREIYILCFVIKELDGKKVYSHSLPDYDLYKKDPENDRELVKTLWDYFDKADILIAHNGDRFDIRAANARFLYHGLPPPSPYKTIDTLKIARKYFKLNSNRLNDLGKYLGLGEKLETGGFSLWKGCMQGDLRSWRKMLKYNKIDVILLEKVYNRLRDWNERRPRTTISYSDGETCPECKSGNIVKWGRRYGKKGYSQLYACKNCGTRSTGVHVKLS